MLQIAFGGYNDVQAGEIAYDDSPVFYEAGYNYISPIEMSVVPSDQIFLILRKRANPEGTVFENISAGDFTVSAVDVTTNRNVPARLAATTHAGWPLPSLTVFLTNSLDIYNPVVRVRTIQCTIRENATNNFISFRILVDDENLNYHYFIINTRNISNRKTFTAVGRQSYVDIAPSGDVYVLFSPYAYLKEVDKSKGDFSYPLDVIYYQRQSTYNQEGYSYDIRSYSHSFVSDNVSIMSVPQYRKAGILLIDKYMYTSMIGISEDVFLDIQTVGDYSEIMDTFRVHLVRSV